MSDDMDRAHRQDSADERRLQDLRRAITEFLRDPPSRCLPATRATLACAADELGEDAARVVRVWD